MRPLEYWDKPCDSNHVPEEYRLAYVLSKLAPFEQARFEMFNPNDKYIRPPKFIWRYALDRLYHLDDIEKCISSFRGRTLWRYDKGSKNSSIEPLNQAFHEVYDIDDVPVQLKEDYKNWIDNCLFDIPELCAYIESKLNIKEAPPQKY